MHKTATVNVRMSPEVKKQAEELFSSFGISLSNALNLFVHQSIIEQRIPFQISRRVPNADFQASIDEMEAMIQGKIPKPPVQSTGDFFAEMRGRGEI
jgi:DNA-damage-inducible protein J